MVFITDIWDNNMRDISGYVPRELDNWAEIIAEVKKKSKKRRNLRLVGIEQFGEPPERKEKAGINPIVEWKHAGYKSLKEALNAETCKDFLVGDEPVVAEKYRKRWLKRNPECNQYVTLEDDKMNKTLPIYTLQETMNPEIWVGDGKNARLKRGIKNKIMDSVRKSLGKHGGTPKRIIIVGSSVGYRWREDGDIDVHVEGKFPNFDYEVDEYPVVNSKLKIEIALMNKKIPKTRVEGMYSITNDKWIKPPERYSGKVFWNPLIEEAISWARKIDLDMGELKRDLLEYVLYKESKSDNTVLARKADEIKSDLNSIIETWDSVKDARTLALKGKSAETRFFKNPSKSRMLNPENLVMKLLQRFQYVELMKRVKSLVRTLQDESDFDHIHLAISNFLKREKWIK